MTKQEFISKYEGWFSYTGRDKLKKQMEADLESVIKALRQCNVVGQSEQLVCDCGNPNLTWYGNDDDKTYFCFECKKEVTN